MSKANIYLCGARGSGKSYCAQALGQYRQRIVYVDPTSTIKSGDFVSMDSQAIARLIDTKETFNAVFWCAHVDSKDFEKELKPIIDAAERKKEWVTIVLDELAVIAPGRKQISNLERSCRMGRHTKTSYWFMSQRLIDAHPNLLALTDRILIFRTASPQDREHARKLIGGKLLSEQMQALREFEYVAIDTQSGKFETRKPIKARTLEKKR